MPVPTLRDRYLDLLRAVALVRVIVFHMFQFAWLSYLFPAMGVMFALAGSLMANSVQRSATRAVSSRLRRLLPAMWVMGAILVPVMLWHGWSTDDGKPFDAIQLLLWVVPVAEPPGSAWAVDATVVLWYLVTYLWFVVLSPLAWLAYRRAPIPTLVAPLLALVALRFCPFELPGRVSDVLVNVSTFGACWLVGFAHRTGQLQRVNRAVLWCIAAALVGSGAAWAMTHPSEDGSLNLNDIPLAQALYSLGFVLIIMRASPSMSWLERVRPLDATVTLFNARAVTIYLWHNAAIWLCFPVGDLLRVWRLPGQLGTVGYFGVALVLLSIVVLALGFVEDLAARRRPALVPIQRRRLAPAAPVPAVRT